MKEESAMKKLFLLFFLPILYFSLSAQDFLTGKLSGANASEQQIFYDRTQNVLGKNIFQSVYKIFDKNKALLYSVHITHDRSKSFFFLSLKAAGAPSVANTIRYERSKSGLIFSDLGNLDTSFNLSKSYGYLMSFTDTAREYPVLHKIKTQDRKDILLDPVTKLRLRKHNELVRIIRKNDPLFREQNAEKEIPKKKDKEIFNAQLLAQRDSLYARSNLLHDKIQKMRSKIESDIAVLFKVKHVYDDAMRYEGDKHKGEAEGTGLFMSNGNYYDGYFRDGKFVSGDVIIHYEAFEYCGEYSFDSLNGSGLLKYKNDSYLLGWFKEGVLYEGVMLSIGKAGDVYFGVCKNSERTGYGELYNTKGEMYYGQFLKGTLVKGYAKDIDPFGFFIYSRMENGIKIPLDTKEGEEFFNSVVSSKNKVSN